MRFFINYKNLGNTILHYVKQFSFILLFSCLITYATAQADSTQKAIEKKGKQSVFRDTLDGKLDFSHFLIDMKGFMPIPMLITEPALGGFGGVMVAAFVKPRKLEGYKGYIPPDITAVMAGYTLNNTWMTGAFRMGSFPKAGVKYRAFAAYSSVNMNFYRELPAVGEKSFSFNFKSVPILFSVSKKIFKELYLGIDYLYLPSKVIPNFDGELPAFVKPVELDNQTSTPGMFLEWDTRNTIFTPDKGIRINTEFKTDAGWTGSDFDYQRLTSFVNWFTTVKDNWISGLRIEGQHVFQVPPFYLLPGINMRGIPIARYQGSTTFLVETEQRFDVNFRWSVLGFTGWGKAIEKGQRFVEAQDVYNVGAGFRYLLARAFKVRAGIDIAKGPDSYGYYIVFGHNWNR